MRGEREPIQVAIVSSSEKSAAALNTLLSGHGFGTPTVVRTGGEIRRNLTGFPYDMVIINTPLSDEYGHELAMDLIQGTTAEVLLLVKNDSFGNVYDEVSAYGVLTVPKPIPPQLFDQSICLAVSSRQRRMRIEKENTKLKKKLEELRLVDRAKCMLIAYEGMSETQAHRHIEKQAMDTRSTRKAVAEHILRAYDG